MPALLGKAGIVDDKRLDARQLPIERAGQPGKQRVRVPRAHDHTLLEALPHRLDLIGAVHQAGGDGFNALPLTIEQQACDVLAHRHPAFGSAEALRHRLHKGRQLAIQALQGVWGHNA